MDVITDTVEIITKPGLSLTQKALTATVLVVTATAGFLGVRKLRKARKVENDTVNPDPTVTA